MPSTSPVDIDGVWTPSAYIHPTDTTRNTTSVQLQCIQVAIASPPAIAPSRRVHIESVADLFASIGLRNAGAPGLHAAPRRQHSAGLLVANCLQVPIRAIASVWAVSVVALAPTAGACCQGSSGHGSSGQGPRDKPVHRPPTTLMSPVSRFLDDADPYAAGGPGAD